MRTRLLALLAAALFCHRAYADLTLSTDGKTDYVITVPDAPTPVQQSAAKELQTSLHEVTGANFAIESSKNVFPATPVIEISSRAGGDDSILIQTSPHHLLLSGSGPRGALYAVYSFLEDSVGLRWWTSNESFTPHTPTLAIPDLNLSYAPSLLYRECYNADPIRNAAFAAHLKLNGHHERIPSDLGGHYSIIGWCHTSFKLMPPATYFDKHPDWYSQINGKRDYHWGQLCWSNPELRKELTKNVLAQIRKDPSAGIISVSQEDCFNPCQCPLCRAIEKEDGTPAGPLLRGVNAVAVEVAKEYPDFLVETLAYQWSRKPPKVTRPAPNVLIRLCSIEANFARPLESQSFGIDLKGWSKIANHLFVWNYVTNFANYLIPHPNLTPIAVDLRLFAANHVIGVFEQSDAFNYPAGDFLELRVWLESHLLWNPSLDQRALTVQFLDGYYGTAGKPLLQYLDLINAPAADPKFFRGCYHPTADFLTSTNLAEASRLFDQAESAVASDPVLLKRIRIQRLILDNVKLNHYDFAAALKTKSSEAVTADYTQSADELIHDFTQAGVQNFSEGQGFSAYTSTLRSLPARAMPPVLPPAGAALPAGSYDIQQNQFSLFKKGTLSELKPDLKASDGQAAVMPSNHTQWAIQFHIPANAPYLGKGPWRCSIVARVDPKQKTGAAFNLGIHDPKSNTSLGTQSISLDQAGDGEYHPYTFILDALHPNQFFWISPAGSAVSNIYVDRIFIQKSAAN